VIVIGKEVVGHPFDEVRAWFRQVDPSFEDEDTGLMSKRLGIALFTEDAKRCPHDKILHAFVFRRGYYDEPTPD